jgi:hypothetical protein
MPSYRAEIVQEQTGFELSWSDRLETLPPPSTRELTALQRLDPKGSRKRFL